MAERFSESSPCPCGRESERTGDEAERRRRREGELSWINRKGLLTTAEEQIDFSTGGERSGEERRGGVRTDARPGGCGGGG